MDLKHLGESLHVSESSVPNSTFDRVDLSSASFKRVKIERAVMTEADLSGLSIARCDLSRAAIRECRLDDMTIDGIPVADLLAAYNARQSAA